MSNFACINGECPQQPESKGGCVCWWTKERQELLGKDEFGRPQLGPSQPFSGCLFGIIGEQISNDVIAHTGRTPAELSELREEMQVFKREIRMVVEQSIQAIRQEQMSAFMQFAQSLTEAVEKREGPRIALPS